MKVAVGILALPFIAAVAALYAPARIRLELYDVQDITYSLTDMPGVDISLARSPSVEDPPLFIGEDIVNRIQALTPGVWEGSTFSTLQFQNGLVIVRGTAAQQTFVRIVLAAHRAWFRVQS